MWELTFDEIYKILDQQNIIDNCIILDLDSTYVDFINQFTFRATTKGNNLDVLSCKQVMKTEDQSYFLKAEVLELKGLENFSSFKYLKLPTSS